MNKVLVSLTIIAVLFSCKTRQVIPELEINSTVYISGSENYSHYRIPAIIFANQTLFAFAEARLSSVDDNGNISIVLKRSNDFGKTWGPLTKVVELEGESVQNPLPVYIEDENKLIVLFTKRTVGTDTEYQLRDGTSKGYVGVYMIESTNNGQSWSAVQEITKYVKKEDWRWYTVGPGGAVIMKYNKKHKNRIIVPSNHSIGKGSGNEYIGAHAIYSDNNGKTWHIGAVDSEGQSTMNPNETAVVELLNGDLYFNTRNQASNDTISNRGFAISNDGGMTFIEKFNHEKQLVCPVVHASMTRNKKSVFFAGPFSKKDRIDLSLWRSDDEAKTWRYYKPLYKGSSAYSGLCAINEKILGVLIEVDDYSRIIFKTVLID